MTAKLLHSVFALPLVICVTGFFLSAGTSAKPSSVMAKTTLKLVGLRTEYKEHPLGIESPG